MSTPGDAPQSTCAWCNHVLTPDEEVCPGCGNRNPIFSRRARAATRAAERREARAESSSGAERPSTPVEGIKAVLGDGCAEGCLDSVLSGLLGVIVLGAAATAIARRQSGRRSGARP